MLTKEERAVIAERLKNAGRLNEFTFYEALTGKQMAPSWDLRAGEILNIIVNLCDTSNMIELPLDKDGEVIHIGDVVYNDEGREWKVNSLAFYDDVVTVEVCSDYIRTVYRSDMLSHKQPAKTSALAEQIRAVIGSAFTMPDFAAKKLSRIADELESLSDKDE